MLLLASAATEKDIGLLVTFIGIGIVVNVIIIYILFQVRGEYVHNQEDRREPRENRV
jgi:hypothetical protein